jgi:predicted RND superfamily exporter protein
MEAPRRAQQAVRSTRAERYAHWVLRHRWAVLVVLGVVSASALVFVPRVGFDASIESWVRPDDPALAAYNAFVDRFGADEITVIGVFADDVFAPAVLKAVAAISEAAARAPYVHRVDSLTTVDIATGNAEGVVIGPLIDHLPVTPQESRIVRARALASPLVAGLLVAPDARATAVVVESTPELRGFHEKSELVNALRRIVAPYAGELEIRLAGAPPLHDALLRHALRDSRVIGLASGGLIALCLYLTFGSVAAVVLTLAVVGIAFLWLGGMMGALGVDLDVVCIELPPVVLAVGIADAVHLLVEHRRERSRGAGREAVRTALGRLLVPCFFTSATTAAGMLSLLASDVRPIRNYGWEAAVAVVVAFVLSVTLLPILMEMVMGHTTARRPSPATRALTRLIAWLVRITARQSRTITIGAVAVGLVAAAALGRLHVGGNMLHYFPPDDPVRQSTERIDQALGGSAALEVMVRTAPEGLKEPSILRRLDRLAERLRHGPVATKVVSVVDRLKEMNRVFTGDPVAGNVVPATRDLVAQFYLLLEQGDDLDTLLQDDYSVGRMTARVRLSDAERLTAALGEIDPALAAGHGEGGMSVTATGYVKLMVDIEGYLVASQLRSFAAAFAVVVVLLGLVLRSARLALFAMIPNVVPIVMGLGFMALAGIPLDPGTVMIGGVAMGLVVDDTVHFLVRLRRQIAGGAMLEEAVPRTLEQVARPIIATSVTLAVGFGAMTAASFSPNAHFGAVTAVVICLALIGDLVVLPAALLWLRPRL